MTRLQHSLNTVRGNPEKDSHLAIELNRMFEEIEQNGGLDERTREEIDEIENEINIAGICEHLERRYSDEDEVFQAVRDVLPLLQEGIIRALNKEWHNVAAEYYYQLVYLKSNLSGHDANTEIQDTLSFLNNNRENIGSHRATHIIDLINRNLDSIGDNCKDEWVKFVETTIEDAHSDDNSKTERTYLRKLHDLKTRYEEDTGSLEDALIETYRSEADWQEDNSLLQKAEVLRAGLNECGQYMSEEKKEDWKKEAYEARKRGTKEELVEFHLGNLPATTYEGDIQEDLVEEMKENAEFISYKFKLLVDKYDSATYALYCILSSEALIPDVTKMRLESEQFVLQDMISRKIISPEYNTLSKNPLEDEDNILNTYRIQAFSLIEPAASAFYQLMKEGRLHFRDFVILFQASRSLSADTETFLIDSLFDLFDENYTQSLFVSLPHIESVIVDTLLSADRVAYTNIERGTQQQNLGGLFKDIDEFDEDFTTYLKWRYTNREGLNLRNRAAHGQLRYANANYLNSLITICDVIRIMLRINFSAYTYAFGPPENVLSQPTNYGKDVDLLLYTDLNRQIIGYGEADDQHSFVVIRRHGNEDETELFVEKGKISRYVIGSADLEKDEIISRIGLLSSEYIEIPSNIEYKWLTNEKILNKIMEIIQQKFDNVSGEVQKESIFEQARVKGIDESTARMAFHHLEENDRIEDREDIVSLTD